MHCFNCEVCTVSTVRYALYEQQGLHYSVRNTHVNIPPAPVAPPVEPVMLPSQCRAHTPCWLQKRVVKVIFLPLQEQQQQHGMQHVSFHVPKTSILCWRNLSGCAFYCTDCTDSSSIPPAPHCSTLCHGFHFLECLSPHLRRALARKQQGLDAYLSPDLRTYASPLSLQVMAMTHPSRLPPWQSPTFSGSTSLRPAG